jgi:hypothetical protein
MRIVRRKDGRGMRRFVRRRNARRGVVSRADW